MSPQIVKLLQEGKVGVIPTDTIYGIVGSALDEKVVEKIYLLRKRNSDKPFIILISQLSDLEQCGIQLTQAQKDFLTKHWPNPLSVALPVTSEKFRYLHRGKKSLAFRMPKDEKLLELLKETGPLVAPSTNFEGEKYAETIKEAKKYFGKKVDLYLDGGRIKSKVSTLVNLSKDGIPTILRIGGFKL